MASEDSEIEIELFDSSFKHCRKNEDQTQYLLSYMEEDKAFACGRFLGSNAHQEMKQKWMNLSRELNSRGFPKSVEKWQRTWKDLKRNVRKNFINYKQAMNATGNIKEDVPTLNKYDKRIIEIIGSLCTGLGIPEDGGFQKPKRKHEETITGTGHDTYSLEQPAARPRASTSTLQSQNHVRSTTSKDSNVPCNQRVLTLDLPFDEESEDLSSSIKELADAVRETSNNIKEGISVLHAFVQGQMIFKDLQSDYAEREESDAGLQ